MRKILLIAACLFFGFATISAQDFVQGTKVLNLGLGIGNTLHSGSGYTTKVPPLSASLEYCIIDNLFDDNSSLGVGGFFGYSSSEYKHNYGLIELPNLKVKYSDVVLAARGALHYRFVDKLGTYAGLALGYDIISTSSEGAIANYDMSSSGFFAGFYVGGRYYFTDKIAAMAEVGYDVAVLKLGVAIKL